MSFFVHLHKGDRLTDRSFLMSLALCVVSIVLCVSCLTFATWAWFRDTATSVSNRIQAADYHYELAVTVDGVTPDEAGVYALKKNVDYTVTLTATGDEGCAYWCRVKIGGRNFYTDQLTPEVPYVFTLKLSADADVRFVGQWGSTRPSSDVRDGRLTVSPGDAGAERDAETEFETGSGREDGE